MTPEPPTPTPRRKRRYLRCLGYLVLGYIAYAGWKGYDYRAAVDEARGLGWGIDDSSPFDDIKSDWHAAFRTETWTRIRRSLDIQELYEYTSHQSLLLRLNPQSINITRARNPLNLPALKRLPDLRGLAIHGCSQMTDANMDQIQELVNLKQLYIAHCPRLTQLNPFIGLKKLEWLYLWSVPLIPEKDIDAFKAAHPDTNVDIIP